MTITTVAAQITSTGISAPSYADILDYLQTQFRTIYGADAVLTPDSQDGQLLAIFALAFSDCNQMAIAVYNEFSPATAQGAGLSSVVKINGLARLVASNSTVDVTIVGQVGTVINNGVVGDNLDLGTQWLLPGTVTIPIGGSIVVTATSAILGDVEAVAHSVTKILTPTAGWQTVDNTGAAVPGAPVEEDATLRIRQAVSTSLPAQSVMDSIIGNVANLPGVQRFKGYENPTGSTDGDTIPPHSISMVVEGGDAVQIATTIALKKTPGTGTYGTTTELVIDARGVPVNIHFYQLAVVQMDVVIAITGLTGYVSTTGALIRNAVALFLSTLDIGEDSYISRLYSPAALNGDAATESSGLTQTQLDALSKTYNITSITQARHSGTQHPLDIVIAFNEATACVIANITLTVT